MADESARDFQQVTRGKVGRGASGPIDPAGSTALGSRTVLTAVQEGLEGPTALQQTEEHQRGQASCSLKQQLK